MSIGILKTITVDFSDDAVYQYVAVKSEEVFSRVIEVILMNDGAEYIIPQGTTARLEARKSDNVPILIDGTIDYTLNRIYFSLTPKCTEIPGIIQCEIALYGEDNRLAISSFFYIDVHRSVLSGTGSANGCGNNVVSSSPEYEAFRTGLLALDDKIKQSNEVVGVVQKQMEEAREALDIATEAAETIVTAKDKAFLAAESANNSASLANEATQAANEAVKTIDGVAETAAKAADEATLAAQEAEKIATAVVTAENARVVAEQERVSNETTRKNNEAKRVIAENNRVTAETARVEAEKLRVRESADAVDDAIDAATAANAASQNANNAIANLNTAINNANVAASYANQAAENVITTNGKMIAAEAERESAEETRQANESTRINQENARVDAELERESAFATAISNAETATQNANDAAQTAIEASQEASLQEAREAAISASESANAAADRATSFLDDAEANEEIRKSNEISRVSAEENRRTEFATWEIELGKISAFDKRIENLEAAVSPDIVKPTVDSSVAYRKSVPANVLPNAAVCEIGGMSYKCENLIPFPYYNNTKTHNGVTWTVQEDGGVHIKGTATEHSLFTVARGLTLSPEQTYTISRGDGSKPETGDTYQMYVRTTEKTYYAVGQTPTAFTTNGSIDIEIAVYAGITVDMVYYPMLNRGESALPYQPYFTGLRDAKVTAIESVGANLIQFPYIDGNRTNYLGVSITINADQSITLNGTATGSGRYKLVEFDGGRVFDGEYFATLGGNILPSGCTMYSNFGEAKHYWLVSGKTEMKTTLSNARTNFISIWLSTGAVFNNFTIYPFLAKSDTALPYTPYVKRTFPIPEGVQVLDGYGQGVNAEYHNKIVLDPTEGVKKFVKQAGRIIFTGSETFDVYGSTDDFFRVIGSWFDEAKNDTAALCTHFPVYGSRYNFTGALCGVVESGVQRGSIFIPYDFFTTETTDKERVATWKAYLAEQYANGTPVTVEYALATTVETDVSAYFTNDNLIGVEAYGEVTAVNEHEQAVPTSIEYTVKGA